MNESHDIVNSVPGTAGGPMMARKCRSAVGGAQTSDKHNALMDEFKRAHQKMFRNGVGEVDNKANAVRFY